MLPFFKGRAETAFTAETGGKSDILYGEVRCAQKIFGGIDPCCNEILIWSIAGFSGKDPGKMKQAHIGISSQCLHGQMFAEMLADVDQRIFNYLRMGKGGFCLRTGIQERIENLGNAIGYHILFNGHCFFEKVNKFFHIVDNRRRIGGGKNNSLNREQLIVGTGKRTVKMKPEDIRIFIKTISMRLIAVQKDKISGRDPKFFILILDQAGTFDKIHKKKTVVAVPPERVSGLVFKISKGYGIKIKPGSCSAGLIEIIVRVFFYFRFF